VKRSSLIRARTKEHRLAPVDDECIRCKYEMLTEG